MSEQNHGEVNFDLPDTEEEMALDRKSQNQLNKNLLREIPWWAVIIVLIGISFIILVLTNQNYQDTMLVLIKGRPTAKALEGIMLTIRITLVSFAIAVTIGDGIGTVVLLPLGIDLINSIGQALNITALAELSLRNISFEVRAIAALAIGFGAYEAEIFRAGIVSIERGQMEAARSLGMTYIQAMRYVILPQAIRRVLPPLGNDFIALLKDSSLATVLAVPELTQLGRVQRSSTFRVFEVFNSVAFLYLTMTLVLSFLVRMLERRLSSDSRDESIR